jgi:L-cysteine desulfidase
LFDLFDWKITHTNIFHQTSCYQVLHTQEERKKFKNASMKNLYCFVSRIDVNLLTFIASHVCLHTKQTKLRVGHSRRSDIVEVAWVEMRWKTTFRKKEL